MTKSDLLEQDGGKEIFDRINVDGLMLNFELSYKLADDLVNGNWIKLARWIGLKSQDDLIEEML